MEGESKKSAKSSIVKAATLLTIGTILSKVLGFVRELCVAYKFGTGPISDAFVLTNSIPTILFQAIATAININFIPFYHRIDTQEGKNKFTSNITNICLVVLLAGCAVMNIFPGIILKIFATGLSAETEVYAIVMLRIVAFSIIPIVLADIFQAYLQANQLFWSTALYGVVTNVVVILFTLASTAEQYFMLSLGTVLSHIIGLMPIFFAMKKRTLFKYKKYMNFKDDQLKSLVLLTMPLIIENVASSMSLLVDRNLASFLEDGVISGLGYAGNIGNIASTMIATAIITATFPTFSKLLANGDKDQFSKSFEKYASVISYLLGPISIFMILNATPIVSFIFEHGSFDSTSTRIVSESMICYAVGVLPMGLQSYLIRGFYAMQDTKTPVKIKVFALICNIALNLASVHFLQHKGIALSTSISYLIAYFMLTHSLKKKHGVANINKITFEGTISLVLSIIPALLVNAVFYRFIEVNNLFIELMIKGVAFLVLFFVLMLIFRRERMKEIIKAV
ncbi:MAG: murein biosynthesis integral membrane protein MurJ [Clostridiales bacterium]|nr:murein biosynthesis integral membrane protein MurJ [Clostridiales bacterium]